MDDLSALREYIDILQEQLKLDIIIYDECRLLKNTYLGSLSVLGKWHTNPYCLKIKENRSLRRRCVALKPNFVEKILKGSGVVKSTCFCGVTEYVLPIRIDGHLVCLVSATGFLGEIKESSTKLLSKCVNMDADAFDELRKHALSDRYDEAAVKRAIEILGYLLEKILIEQIDISQRITTMHQTHTLHVHKAIEYISDHFTDLLDADTVAKHCHINTSYLQHLFSEVLGHGIAEEIRSCRLSYAKDLLCKTDYSVRYISYLAGFSSSDYFSTAFKKHYGCSPLGYRKKYQQNKYFYKGKM